VIFISFIFSEVFILVEKDLDPLVFTFVLEKLIEEILLSKFITD